MDKKEIVERIIKATEANNEDLGVVIEFMEIQIKGVEAQIEATEGDEKETLKRVHGNAVLAVEQKKKQIEDNTSFIIKFREVMLTE